MNVTFLRFVTCAILIMPGWTSPAFAQPQRRAPGWGEKIVHVRDLPPDGLIEMRRKANRDLAVGFYYQRWGFLGDELDFWTWDGKYVLFQGKRYFESTDEELVQLIGKDGFGSLGK